MSNDNLAEVHDLQAQLDAALKAVELARRANEEMSDSEMTYMLNYGAAR